MNGDGARRGGLGLLGFGAAACLACCAPLILGVLGGLTAASLASTLVIGGGGLAIAAAAAVAFVVVRRRSRARACGTGTSETVPVDAPTRRVSA